MTLAAVWTITFLLQPNTHYLPCITICYCFTVTSIKILSVIALLTLPLYCYHHCSTVWTMKLLFSATITLLVAAMKSLLQPLHYCCNHYIAVTTITILLQQCHFCCNYYITVLVITLICSAITLATITLLTLLHYCFQPLHEADPGGDPLLPPE